MTTTTLPFGIKPKIIPEPERDEFGAIIYPSEDGLPMSYNTIHFHWIMFLKFGLETFFADRPDVFIAGDLLWYPLEGRTDVRVGPDVFVAMGRPKGDRSSYKQWEEGGVAPQVVFEILSPGNTVAEMIDKQAFYSRFGVKEYIIFNPENSTLNIFCAPASEGGLVPVTDSQGWCSPLMNLTFWVNDGQMHVVLPDGSQMLSPEELEAKRKEAEAKREQAESQRDEATAQRDAATAQRDAAAAQRDAAEARANALAARLKELGVDPQ